MAVDRRGQQNLLTVFSQGNQWWIRAEPSSRSPHTLGPNGDMTGATADANLRRKNNSDRWPTESWKRARGPEGGDAPTPTASAGGTTAGEASEHHKGVGPLWDGYKPASSSGHAMPFLPSPRRQ